MSRSSLRFSSSSTTFMAGAGEKCKHNDDADDDEDKPSKGAKVANRCVMTSPRPSFSLASTAARESRCQMVLQLSFATRSRARAGVVQRKVKEIVVETVVVVVVEEVVVENAIQRPEVK